MSEQVKIALVTGANKGIGKAIVKGLANKGVTVLLGARNAERGMKAVNELKDEGKVDFLKLDVTDSESVASACNEIEKNYGRLDILVNNAGVALGNPKPGEATADDFREIYETNVFAVVEVTNKMLPLLKRSSAGRIVNISSIRGSLGAEGAFVGQPYIAYSSSKTAHNALTVHYARELRDTKIKVNSAAPGHVATDFNNFKGIRTPEEGAAIAIRLAMLDENGPTGGFLNDDGTITW